MSTETGLEVFLGDYQDAVDNVLGYLHSKRVLERIWKRDHTLWSPDPEEISNRLGWLQSPEVMVKEIERIQDLLRSVQANGYSHALLLGMGGSSLSAELFASSFGHDHEGLALSILDSTDPGAVLAYAAELDPAQTLFIVSTKSGGTEETLSFFKYFYNRTIENIGSETAGSHFVAITDAGSKLHDIAVKYSFRAVFLNDSSIGGRYSALSHFGLVPAGVVGVDLERLLNRAQSMALSNGGNSNSANDVSAGSYLGAIMAELAQRGRDKLTLITSPDLANFAEWVEQLIAESTGKNGKGILPVVGEELGPVDEYGSDRLFVLLRLAGDQTLDASIEKLTAAGHPIVTLELKDLYDLGGQFFLWEIATAVAGHVMGIQPFNQPNVESAKILTRQMVAAYQKEGRLPKGDSSPPTAEALSAFLKNSSPGDYVSIQAYVQPTEEMDAALHALRLKVRKRTGLATTLGYGPRFLHSTGQLHKGDAGNGLFIQFVSKEERDVQIPKEAGSKASALSFGVLKNAQALGDAQALIDAGRRVIRFQVEGDGLAVIEELGEALTQSTGSR